MKAGLSAAAVCAVVVFGWFGCDGGSGADGTQATSAGASDAPQCVTPARNQLDTQCFPDELGEGPIEGIGSSINEAGSKESVTVEFNGFFVKSIDGMACVACDFLAPKPVDQGEYFNCDHYYYCGDSRCHFHVAIGGYDDRSWKVFADNGSVEGCEAYDGAWELGAADIAPWECMAGCKPEECTYNPCGEPCPACSGSGSTGSGSGSDPCSDCYDACAGISGCSCCAECGVPCWN